MTISSRVYKLVVLLLLAASVTTTGAVSRKVQTRETRVGQHDNVKNTLVRGQPQRKEVAIERELLPKGMCRYLW